MDTIHCKEHRETPRNSWMHPVVKDTDDPTGELKAIEAFRNRYKHVPSKVYEFEGNFYFVVPVVVTDSQGTRVLLD